MTSQDKNGVCIEDRGQGLLAATFAAMASPCEVLVETADREAVTWLGALAAREAARIESKFSRYRPDSVLAGLNAAGGESRQVDEETANLLDFAERCFQLSEGAFDVTSGVLRKAWRFDGTGQLPSQAVVAEILTRVGFDKLTWRKPYCTVPLGMELDFGGIGKEYAVDRVLQLIAQQFSGAVLVNFGGDLACNRAPQKAPWVIGVERPDTDRKARLLLELTQGALATSGDTHRRIEVGGRRYGHILDVRTGWPVRDAPRSVTVAAAGCVEAGLLATLAVLKGLGAEQFLMELGVQHWCLR